MGRRARRIATFGIISPAAARRAFVSARASGSRVALPHWVATARVLRAATAVYR